MMVNQKKKEIKKIVKAPKKRSFYIESFDDYHSIEDDGEYKAIELGCFVPTDGNYSQYFGLFYKNSKPKLDDIINDLKSRVALNQEVHHFRTNKLLDVVTEDTLRKNIEEVLKRNKNG